MGWLICGKADVVEDTAIIAQNEALKRDQEQLLEERTLLNALKRDQEQLLEERKLLNEKQEEYNKKNLELETKRTKFLEEQQQLTKNQEIRAEKEEKLCVPNFYMNGVEIDKKDVLSNGEGVIMTNYLCCMEEVLSKGG